MKRERYSIIYSSKTGNTKKLAEAIYNTLPQNKCDYYGTVDKIDDVLSNVIYIGFWTEKGNADHLTIDFLNKLKNNDNYEEIKEALNPSDYNMIVTPKEIDDLIENMKDVVARGINFATQK